MRFRAVYAGPPVTGFTPTHSYPLEVYLSQHGHPVIVIETHRRSMREARAYASWPDFWANWKLDISHLLTLCS